MCFMHICLLPSLHFIGGKHEQKVTAKQEILSDDSEFSALPSSKWESLTIKSRFIFAKVMQQKEFCLSLLLRLFPELDITDVEYADAEKTLEGSIGSKGVRLDVYVKDPKRFAFTLEMQVVMCEDFLSAGGTYASLPAAYVIMFCPFDLFHKGLHCYTFMYTCAEDSSVVLEDGSAVIFLNSRGTADDVSPEVLSFLKYMEGTVTEDDPCIVSLDEAVRKAKKTQTGGRNICCTKWEIAREKELARE